MKKKFYNPFGSGDTHVDSTLPPKGTGLESGTAGERSGGTPRTEEERKERHTAKAKEEPFKEVVRDGIKYKEMQSYKPSIKDQWREHHKKHGK